MFDGSVCPYNLHYSVQFHVFFLIMVMWVSVARCIDNVCSDGAHELRDIHVSLLFNSDSRFINPTPLLINSIHRISIIRSLGLILHRTL